MKTQTLTGILGIDLVKARPHQLFVFADNDLAAGKLESALRDLPNTVGIRIKKGPSDKPVSHYTDLELEQNISKIREDLQALKLRVLAGETPVFLESGYGRGSALEKTAPETFSVLCKLLDSYFGFNNLLGKIVTRVPSWDQIHRGSYISLDNKRFQSGVLSPLNNSFFKAAHLQGGLNTLYQLVLSAKKTAFTYPLRHQIGDIVLLSVATHGEYLVCRIVDSYDWESVTKDTWLEFEGLDVSFLSSFGLKDPTQRLYQNQIQFICLLGQSGQMEFESSLFGNPSEVIEVTGFRGHSSLVESPAAPPAELVELLKKQGLGGRVVEIPNSQKDFKLWKKTQYQVYQGGNIFVVEYTKSLIRASIKILDQSTPVL